MGYAIVGGVIMKKQKEMVKKERITVGPFGTYTGRPLDPGEKPIQDADDL